MPTPSLTQARSHYDRQRRITQFAVRAVRAVWRREPSTVSVSRAVRSAQYTAAVTSTETIAGWSASPEPMVRPEAFVGWTGEGLRVEDALAPLVDELLAQAAADVEEQMYRLDRAVQSHVADAGRSSSQVEFVARPDWQNYVRMLTPPSCPRCAILAGRVYRDLEAFARHPGCDCVMVPVQDWQDAHDNGLVSSFNAAFERGDVRGMSKADAQAIRDGADPSQVVNAGRGSGLIVAGRGQTLKVTSEATTKRGFAAARMRASGRNLQQRLRPESIYALAGDDRDLALQMLYDYGYLLNRPSPNAP